MEFIPSQEYPTIPRIVDVEHETNLLLEAQKKKESKGNSFESEKSSQNSQS